MYVYMYIVSLYVFMNRIYFNMICHTRKLKRKKLTKVESRVNYLPILPQ